MNQIEQQIVLAIETKDPELLRELSFSRSIRVKAAVGGNVRADSETLTRLSKSKSVVVRKSVAGNPSIPFENTKHLKDDEDLGVRMRYFFNSESKISEEEKDFPDLD